MRLIVVIGMAFVVACGGTTNNATTYTNSCTADAKECVSATLARACPSDGSGWLAVACGPGETCSNGDCAADPAMQPCTHADDSCTSATTALLCNSTGVGFTSVTCPANTQCVGGACAGSCVVGSTACLDMSTMLTCGDGFNYTRTTCPSGQACSDQGGGECLPAACTPGVCSEVCGDKAVDPNSASGAYVSFCQDTLLGWKWASVPCAAPKTCSPEAACNAVAIDDGCTSECNPGELRCSDDGLGVETCTAAGTWAAVSECDHATGQVCVSDAFGTPLGCGDALCNNGAGGYCVIDAGTSKLVPCDANGHLTTTPTACTVGVCVENSDAAADPFTGHRPGACTPQCQAGDQRCDETGLAVQGCTANETWSVATTPCTTSNPSSACYAFTVLGAPRAVCGVCQPGDVRCVDSGGSPNPGPVDYTQSCDQTGQWGPTTACVASYCIGGMPGCIANCQAGDEVCVASDPDAALPAPASFGKTSYHACLADGRISPASIPCAAGTSCRKDINGNSYGCVVCVGSNNEAGSIDTQCTGTPGIQTCAPTNDGYMNAVACPATEVCYDEADPRGGIASPAICAGP